MILARLARRVALAPAPSPPERTAGWQAVLPLALAAPAVAWVASRWLGLNMPWPGAAAATWLLLAGPLVEEVAFRAWLQRGLADRLGWHWPDRQLATGLAACALAAAAFAAAHAPLQGWAALWWLLPGLALGEAWRRTQRLAACVGLHAWFNACLMAVSG